MSWPQGKLGKYNCTRQKPYGVGLFKVFNSSAEEAKKGAKKITLLLITQKKQQMKCYVFYHQNLPNLDII